jgi:hypothetical protein
VVPEVGDHQRADRVLDHPARGLADRARALDGAERLAGRSASVMAPPIRVAAGAAALP